MVNQGNLPRSAQVKKELRDLSSIPSNQPHLELAISTKEEVCNFPAKDNLQFSQVQVRTEVHNWQKLAKNGDEGTECREKILGLLSKFREAQRQQDLLIEKEKLRLDAFRNCINEDTTNRIKKRLTFFQKLNKQHEALLEHVRQDIQDCRMICKKFSDSSGK